MRPFVVQRIDHIVLRVRDLDRSQAFYRDLLGCEVARRRDELGLRHLRAGASMIDLISVDGTLGTRGGTGAGAQGRTLDHLCLRIEPFGGDTMVLLVPPTPRRIRARTRASSSCSEKGLAM